MFYPEVLHRQLIDDLERLNVLIVRYAQGERHLRQERDRLEGAVLVKMALLTAQEKSPDTT